MNTLKTRFLPAIGVTILLLAGCYTTFNHPPIYSYGDSTDVYLADEVTFLDDCSSCHERDLAIEDTHHQLYDAPAYTDDYSWQYYYVTPWWIDEYYYLEEAQDNADSQLPATQRRGFDRREVPTSPSAAAPGSATPTSSLAKPATEEQAPAVAPPPLPQRNERRQVVTPDNSRIERQPPPPETNQTETKAKKKEKE